MATLIKSDGTQEPYPEPKNGSNYSLEELQTAIGGYIQVVELPSGDLLVCDEEGKLKGRPVNWQATEITREVLSAYDVMVGDVLQIGPEQIK